MTRLVEKVKKIVRKEAEKSDPGDWPRHIAVVHSYAVNLAEKTGADKQVVEVAAYLHDIGRLKFDDASHDVSGAAESERILKELGCEKDFIENVKHCVLTHRSRNYPPESLEAKIVASADAMAHFDNVPWLLEMGLKITGDKKAGVKWLLDKLERNWKEKLLIPEAKEMMRAKYKSAKILLERSLKRLEEQEVVTLRGTVVTGFGNGAFFVRKYAGRIRDAVGFTPFAGTLNITADAVEVQDFLANIKPIEIRGFSEGKRVFGRILLYRAEINGLPCFVLRPERTRHGEGVVEVIAEFNLKEKLRLKNGSAVEIEA